MDPNAVRSLYLCYENSHFPTFLLHSWLIPDPRTTHWCSECSGARQLACMSQNWADTMPFADSVVRKKAVASAQIGCPDPDSPGSPCKKEWSMESAGFLQRCQLVEPQVTVEYTASGKGLARFYQSCWNSSLNIRKAPFPPRGSITLGEIKANSTGLTANPFLFWVQIWTLLLRWAPSCPGHGPQLRGASGSPLVPVSFWAHSLISSVDFSTAGNKYFPSVQKL